MAVRLTVPVTIVTGFLGSGKTTLVNRILREPHGARIAVIENEYGEVGVDAEFLAGGGAETIVQLVNGCICCNVRGDLAKALHELQQAATQRQLVFDRVLIETTGLADPGPVIQTFRAETAIEAHYHLDGVVAVVDAAHAAMQADRIEFQAQVAYADRIVLSKCDVVSGDSRPTFEAEIAQLNPHAPVQVSNLHEDPIDALLAHVFDTRAHAIDHVPAEELRRALGGIDLGRPGDGRLRSPGLGLHTRQVGSCVFTTDEPLDLDALNAALDDLIARYGPRLWRCKGVVHAAERRSRLILQGVQGSVQISGGTLWRPFEPRRTVLVFIGQGIDAEVVEEALHACAAA
jgi:G3E family GTPase